MSLRGRRKRDKREKGALAADEHHDVSVRVMDYVFPPKNHSKKEIRKSNGRILRRDTAITSVTIWSIPLPGDEGDITFAEMHTDTGVGYFGFARRSVLDPVDPEQAEDVIRGRLERCHKIWREGKKVQKKVTLAGVIPKKTMLIQVERQLLKSDKEPSGEHSENKV